MMARAEAKIQPDPTSEIDYILHPSMVRELNLLLCMQTAQRFGQEAAISHGEHPLDGCDVSAAGLWCQFLTLKNSHGRRNGVGTDASYGPLENCDFLS